MKYRRLHNAALSQYSCHVVDKRAQIVTQTQRRFNVNEYGFVLRRFADDFCGLNAKFRYAIGSQTGPKLVADLSQTC